jgi:predicted lipoprotein with Yx(FWY)xxD motif
MTRRATPIAFLASIAAMGLAPFALAACGGSGATASTTRSKASTAPAPAQASIPPASVGTTRTGLGKILVDSHGRTLYLFTHDSARASTCTGVCATVWLPLVSNGMPRAAAGVRASLLGTTKRPDGTMQVTYKGHPLYRFVKDVNPGQTNGQGVTAFGGSWFAVTARGSRAGQPPSSHRSGSQQTAPTATQETSTPAREPAAPKPVPEAEAPNPTTPKPRTTPKPTTTPKAEPPAEAGIPQNGGGDGDSDNNGGPSDGDGNV